MYTIRRAVAADAETIRQLANETWWPAYSPILPAAQIEYMLADIYDAEKISAQIRHNVQTYLLLYHDETPVGFAAFSPRENNPDVYKLHKLYCLPAVQGKGFGRALIQEVATQTLAAGVHMLELNVNRHNKAKGMYEKMGFVVQYEEDIPIGPYFMNDYVMRKVL